MTGKNYLGKVIGYLLLSGGFALAQISSGTILGAVSDSTGAVVPGATITIRNLATGISRTLITDAAGRYVAPEVALGSYEVTAEASGFQNLTRRGIEISVGRQAAVDFQMTVGAVAEQVTVTGEALLIEGPPLQ